MNRPNKLTIDLEAGRVVEETSSYTTIHPIDSPEAYGLISQVWLRSGWQTNQVYSYTWLGRPIIQLPEDMVRTQEVLHTLRPDVIVETGIAHGGSLVFYASLCELMGHGRVIGVDIDIREHNRKAIEEHPLFHRITLIEGDSINPVVVEKVRSMIEPDESVLVMLDGLHTAAQVTAELEAYSPLVSKGSYIVAADGIMESLAGLRRHNDERSTDDWDWNNPKAAAEAFVAEREGFIIEAPPFEFNESPISEAVTYWPSGWIKRVG
jgi:cephalosporin hydroxylase